MTLNLKNKTAKTSSQTLHAPLHVAPVFTVSCPPTSGPWGWGTSWALVKCILYSQWAIHLHQVIEGRDQLSTGKMYLLLIVSYPPTSGNEVGTSWALVKYAFLLEWSCFIKHGTPTIHNQLSANMKVILTSSESNVFLFHTKLKIFTTYPLFDISELAKEINKQANKQITTLHIAGGLTDHLSAFRRPLTNTDCKRQYMSFKSYTCIFNHYIMQHL